MFDLGGFRQDLDQLLAQIWLCALAARIARVRCGISPDIPMFGAEQTWSDEKASIRRMSYENAYTRTFRRAIETLGSVERLAQAIGASGAEIEAWAKGNAHPPPSAFLKAIDVVAQIGPRPQRAAKS